MKISIKNHTNLLKKLSVYSIYPLICLFVSGCSEFNEVFNDEFNSSFVSRCIERYDKNWRHLSMSRSEVLSYCECLSYGLKDDNNNVQFSRFFQDLNNVTDYCFERVFNY